MRLLFVVNDAEFFISHRLQLGIAAREKGMAVCVAAPSVSPLVENIFERSGLAWDIYSLDRSGADPRREFRSLRELNRIVSRWRPDLVHNVGFKAMVHGTAVAASRGLPVVNAVSGLGHMFSENGNVEMISRRVMFVCYRLIACYRHQRLIVQNHDDLDLMTGRVGFETEKVHLIKGTGVEVEEMPPNAVGSEITLVLLIGRMLRTKGVYEFVEAARLLRKSGVKARFALVGRPDPGNRATIKEDQLWDWHSEGVVEYWGWQTPEQITTILKRPAIVCLPSYREGLSRVLLQAAAAGKAIVTTDVPGNRELIENGRNGILISARNVRQLAKAIEYLLNDRELQRRLGTEAREKVTSNGFTLEAVVSQTLATYSELLGPV